MMFLIGLAACGKVEGGIVDARDPNDGDTTADTPPAQHWSKLATVAAQVDLGNNRGFMAVGQGTDIYLAPISDPPQVTNLQAFSTTSLQVTANLPLPPGTSNDFEASGFGAVFVADADAIYLLGDAAYRFRRADNAWRPISGYGPSTNFMRGEACGTWETATGVLYMVGGRDRATNQDQGTAIRLNPDGSWSNEPGAMPYTVSNCFAVQLPGENRIFIAGGRTGDNNRKHLAVHTTSTSGWTALADAPDDLGNAIGMGYFEDDATRALRVLVATETNAYLFNPASMTWDRTIDMPAGDRAQLVMVGGVAHAVVQQGVQIEVWRLDSVD